MSTRREISEFYDNWVPDQVKIGINLRHRIIFRLLKGAGIRRHHSVLEVGCGVGPVTRLLAEYLKRGSVTAVDISPKSIDQARQHLGAFQNVNLLVSDMSDFVPDKRYDVILLPDVLEHIPFENHFRLFGTLAEALADTGIIVIHIPHPVYQDWIRKAHPEKLQIIDHSLYIETIIKPIFENGLYVARLTSHSIFQRVHDYQVLLLRKRLGYIDVPHRSRFAVLFHNIMLRLLI